MTYTCEVYNRQGIRVATSVSLIPQWASAHERGGPESAEIAAFGSVDQLRQIEGWMDYKIVILNPSGDPIWWGRINRATINRGQRERGTGLDAMANRVKVIFMLIDEDGNSARAETEWAENEYSIAEYGYHEERYSIGNATPEQAVSVRDVLLQEKSLPRPTSSPGQRGIKATIFCRGPFFTLDRQYVSNPSGRIVFDASGNNSQPVGWGITNDDGICFADGCLQDIDARLDGLSKNVQLQISGTSGNNGLHICDGSPDGDGQQTYTSDTISFEAADDIKDMGKGLNFIPPGFVFGVSGSTLNDGYHLAETQEDRGYITTENTFSASAIQDEAAGPSITLTRGQKIRLSTPTALEGTGNVTIRAAGQQVAYSVQHSESDSFIVGEIVINAKKFGNPTDHLVVAFAEDSTGAPGAILDIVQISGENIYRSQRKIVFSMNNSAEMSPANTYWIIISRSGSPSPTDYYEVSIEEHEDGGGTLLLFDGDSWITRQVAGHLPFEIWGHIETVSQIARIIDLYPGRTLGHSARIESGVFARQYRDGTKVALNEIEKLIESGTSDGKRLRIYCGMDDQIIIELEADPQVPTLRSEEDGSLTRWGRALKQGEMPVGEWAEDITFSGQYDLADSTMQYIERCRYNFAAGKLEWYERGAVMPLDIEQIIQG